MSRVSVAVAAAVVGTIDRALREYTTLRKNPNAVSALALADPSFGSALALYLAIPP